MAKNSEWTTIIQPKNSLLRLNLKEVWEYRDLIFLFIKRNFVTQFKQTILGPIWFFLQPILTTAMFLIVFGKIAKIPTDGIPKTLFYLNGIVLWNYFSGTLNNTSNTFVANAPLFKKVYFPRLVIPISIVISNLMKLAIQMLLFFLVLGYYFLSGFHFSLTIYAFLLPFLILHLALLSFSIGIIISSLTTKYRDFSFLIGFGVQLWMYATPVVYPLSQVPEKWRNIYSINPLVPILELFKKGFLNAGSSDLKMWFFSFLITLFLLFFGIVIFNKVEKNFIDTV